MIFLTKVIIKNIKNELSIIEVYIMIIYYVIKKKCQLCVYKKT